MKRFLLTVPVLTLLLSACGNTNQTATETSAADTTMAITAAQTTTDNTLTDQEKREGWQLLFDGTSTDKWRGASRDNFPAAGWKVEDGVLMVEASDGAESQNGGDIVTKQEFDNFEFALDFKITEGANSGIKYFVTEEYPTEGSAIGLEYQILDDERHPDAKLGNNGGNTRTIGSLYDLKAAPQDKQVNPIGEWNHARLVVQGSHVEHWLNGQKVLEYDRGSDEYNKLVAGSKYKDYQKFGMAEAGHLLLQDHGDRVYFKNIKVRELPAS